MPAPANAKKPQDHKAAKAEATVTSVDVEFNDATYSIEAESLNDVEVLEMVCDMRDGDELLLPKIVRTLLGDEQWKAFKNSNRNEKGRVPGEALSGLFNALDDAAGNLQASPGS